MIPVPAPAGRDDWGDFEACGLPTDRKAGLAAEKVREIQEAALNCRSRCAVYRIACPGRCLSRPIGISLAGYSLKTLKQLDLDTARCGSHAQADGIVAALRKGRAELTEELEHLLDGEL